MICVFHLFWIIPLSAWFGFGISAVLSAGKEEKYGDSFL